MLTIIALIIAYLIGSISCSIIFCHLFASTDPRKTGSKNAGATNVLRCAGKLPALFTLLGDVLKGVVPVVAARAIGIEGVALGYVCIAVLIGHIYPIFFGFHGGKGIATSLGAILALSPTIGLLVVITWLIVFIITRFVSLSSIIATIIGSIAITIILHAYYWPFIMLLLIIWRHRTNISRLFKGTENRFTR